LGHEPMGRVAEVGPGVTSLKPGDRVVVPFNISCGDCFFCAQGLQSQCETTQVREHHKGAALFGYTHLYGAVPGGQAEYLRVPMAHYGPVKVPEGPPDERFLYLSDVLPTAWQAVQYAGVPAGGSLTVYGLGPIGLMCVRIARQLGVERVIAVDLVDERLELGRRWGAETIDYREHDDVAREILDRTKGRGTDSVIDAVGMEAEGSKAAEIAQALKIQMDRLEALRLSIGSVRRGGTLSIVGVYVGVDNLIPMGDLFDKQVQIRMGQANVRRWVDDILPLLTGDADPLGTEELATHHLPLDAAPAAYDMFQRKQDGCVKVVLHPGEVAA
ncbi:MAG TPA: zinc-binding dehydrogenase, partial [Egibacteraceae bacterium]|nr:zinc-binding dehydrogenase [Egibacteraceae bacterium]